MSEVKEYKLFYIVNKYGNIFGESTNRQELQDKIDNDSYKNNWTIVELSGKIEVSELKKLGA